MQERFKSNLEFRNQIIVSGVFPLVCNYLRPSNNSRQLFFNINAVVLALKNCLLLRKRLNVYLNFSIFTVFLKNRNFISKMKRSKVTDSAALSIQYVHGDICKHLGKDSRTDHTDRYSNVFQNIYKNRHVHAEY